MPKGATIEKQVVLHTGRYTVEDEEGIEEVVIGEPTFLKGERSIKNDGPYLLGRSFDTGRGQFSVL